MPIQQTAQAKFFTKWCYLLWYLKLQQIALVKFVFYRRGVLCSASSYVIGSACRRRLATLMHPTGIYLMPMDYNRYPDNWQEISLRIRRRDGWQCKWCEAREQGSKGAFEWLLRDLKAEAGAENS
jgi:hypothetical protein